MSQPNAYWSEEPDSFIRRFMLVSASLVVYALHAPLPFVMSKPSRAKLVVPALIIAIPLGTPYSLAPGLLGLKTLPLPFITGILGFVAVYLTNTELVKYWFFNQGT